MNTGDAYQLSRFVLAQESSYDRALADLGDGRKQPHWIWYIFPQVADLGRNSIAEEYAIRSKQEAVAYLTHDLLGPRLRECVAALLSHPDRKIEDIVGYPDDLKLRSSMTLFASLSDPGSVFHEVLETFYAGQMDSMTLARLEE